MRRWLIQLYKKLFVRRFFYRFHQRLLTVSLWGLGILNSENHQLSGEASAIQRLRQLVGHHQQLVVFDIGAHSGSFSRLVLAYHPTARLFAFEPHPQTFVQLQQQIQHPGVELINQAVGADVGQALLYDRADAPSTHASLFAPVLTELHGQVAHAIPVVLTTVDQCAASYQLERIDLLKIDVEGNELAVLQGASQMLAEGRIACVLFEFNEMHVISRVFLRDLLELLPGYQPYRLLPDGPVPLAPGPLFMHEIFAFQNILAVRNPTYSCEQKG